MTNGICIARHSSHNVSYSCRIEEGEIKLLQFNIELLADFIENILTNLLKLKLEHIT